MIKNYVFNAFLVIFITSGSSCKIGQSSRAQVQRTVLKKQVEIKSQPNIIFILADDLGWGELASYGNSFNETPNLDKLASQGLQFDRAYAAAAVCSPTRASLMTGQYPARVGITDFLAPHNEKYLEPELHVTINEALSQQGYHTGMIGKWHLDTDFKNNPGGPYKHNFDEVIATETKYIADGDYFYPYDKINTLEGEEGEFLTDRLAEEAVDFIGRNKEKPFYLYLSHYSVHTTLDAPEELVEKYKKKFNKKYGEGKAEVLFDGQEKGRHRANHIDNPYLAAMLERIDAGVGKIMEKLEEEGIAENTILIFFSDNGGAGNVANNGGLRGNKLTHYEGGFREPLIVRWPEKIKGGQKTNVPVYSVDFYPTFVEAAGGVYPEGQILDGLSLMPLLTEGKAPDRDTFFWHYPSETAGSEKRMSGAVTKGDYKLIHFYADGRKELFNLEKDPSEKNNMAAEMPEKVEELQELLDNWKAEVNARKPEIEN